MRSRKRRSDYSETVSQVRIDRANSGGGLAGTRRVSAPSASCQIARKASGAVGAGDCQGLDRSIERSRPLDIRFRVRANESSIDLVWVSSLLIQRTTATLVKRSAVEENIARKPPEQMRPLFAQQDMWTFKP
ncbi:unnamed protein product, partial [Iphiclides podalirius]